MNLLIAFSCQRLGCILNLPENLLCSSDCNLYRKDRKTREGGVCTFIKAVYSSFLIDLPVEYDDVEIICTGVVCKMVAIFLLLSIEPAVFQQNAKNIVINSSYIATLYRISRLNNQVITIVGDFNLPDVNWESGLAPDDGVQLKLSEFFFDNGFIQFNNNPTRKDNILDLLFCNEPMFVSHLVTSAPFNTSDPDSLIFSLLIDSRIDTTLSL